MIYIYIFSVLFFLIIFNYIYNYYYYHYKENKDFTLFKRLNIDEFDFLTFDYLLNNHGDKEVYLCESKSSSSVMPDEDIKYNNGSDDMYIISDGTNYKKSTIKDFINDDLVYDKWYLKYEDDYNFFKMIGMEEKFINVCKNVFSSNKSDTSLNSSVSFWCGGKNTKTPWHTDFDDKCFLYVIHGKKKVKIVKPKYDKNMYKINKYFFFSLWSEVDFSNPDYEKHPLYKDVEIKEIILNSGDGIHIPRNWWHCVENLEPTIALTYCSYSKDFYKYSSFPEIFRKIYYTYFKPEIIRFV